MSCDKCGACETCGRAETKSASDHHVRKHLEHGFKKFWRPIAAYIYLTICVFDFMAMPLYVNIANRQVDFTVLEEVRKFEDTTVQMAVIEKLDVGKGEWQPLTLLGGAFFHLSFGAILGVSAFTRGQEKKAAIEYDK